MSTFKDLTFNNLITDPTRLENSGLDKQISGRSLENEEYDEDDDENIN